jgi:hypothetical protein
VSGARLLLQLPVNEGMSANPGEVTVDLGRRDDETELDRITREDIYRQRIYSDTWTKCEGTFEIDTHKWRSWELVIYLALLAFSMWYALARINIEASNYVSAAVRDTFDRPGAGSAMSWSDPDVRAEIEKLKGVASFDMLSTPEEVASWTTYFLAQAMLPSIQGFTMPFGAIRMTNRRVKLVKNPSTRFSNVYPLVWIHDEGIEATNTEHKERENTSPFGAARVKGPDGRLRFMTATENAQCDGTPLQTIEMVTIKECEEHCSSAVTLNTIEVCRCATYKFGTCMLSNVAEERLDPVSVEERLRLEMDDLVKAPTVYMPNATTLHPVIRRFQHDPGFRRGFQETPGFVEFVPVESAEYSAERLKYMVKDQMAELFGGGFVTRETATLVLDFVAYHVNYEYYCWLRFDFTFLPEGGVITTFNTETLPAGTGSTDKFSESDLVFAISVGVWIIYEVGKLRTRLFKSVWLVADLAYAFFAVMTIWSTYSYLDLDPLSGDSRDYSNASDLVEFFKLATVHGKALAGLLRVSSVFMLLSWLRVIKYLSDTSSHVAVLADTMKRASTAIVFFMVIIIVMLFGFVSWASVYFGTKLKAFNGFRNALMTCLDWTFGVIDVVPEMQDKYPDESILFFLPFMLVIYFVFVNFNNAILNAAYDNSEKAWLSKLEVRSQDTRAQKSLWMRMRSSRLFKKCFRNPAPPSPRKRAAVADDDSYGELEGESCTMIVLYVFFAIVYIMLMAMLCHIGPSYDMHEAVTGTISKIPVTNAGRTLTIDDLTKPKDVLLWVQQALPKLLYSETEGPLARYFSRPLEFPQLVMRDWTVFYGQKPVRLMMRLYDTELNRPAITNGGILTRYKYVRKRPPRNGHEGMHSHKVSAVLADYPELMGPNQLAKVRDPLQRDALSSSISDVVRCNTADGKCSDGRLCHLAEEATESKKDEFGNPLQIRVTGHPLDTTLPSWSRALTYGYRQGFVCSIPAEPSLGGPILEYLGERNFISEQTASLVIDFVLFNANVGLFTYVAIEFTFPPSGTVSKDVYTCSMRLNPYDGEVGFLRMCLFFTYIGLTAVFILDEVKSLWTEFQAMREREPRILMRFVRTCIEHFTHDFYNVLDTVSYAVSSLTILSWMAYYGSPLRREFIFPEVPEWTPEKCSTEAGGPTWCSDDDVIQEFYLLSILFRNFVRVGSINCLIICVRVLKFFRGDERMNVVTGTLVSAVGRVLWFFVMLTIILMGFVMMGHIAFGSKYSKFASVQDALMMCFQMVIGNYEYEKLERTDGTLAVIFHVPFMLVFYFVLMNIFLAIIDKSFRDQEAKFQLRRRNRKGKHSKGGLVKKVRLFFASFWPHGRGRISSDEAREEKAVDKDDPLSPKANGREDVEQTTEVAKTALDTDALVKKCKELSVRQEVLESWLIMDDDSRAWALEVAAGLYTDLVNWDQERKELGGTQEEVNAWLTETLDQSLNERLDDLEHRIQEAEQRNRREVLYDLSQAMTEQDLLCAHIQSLQDDLSRTQALREENDATYERLRDAASALIFGRQDANEEA